MFENTQDLIEVGQSVVMNTYGRLPLALVKGKGTEVWDMEGKRYLDFVTGLAVNSLGHSHPAVTKAISEQAGEIVHTSNLYWVEHQVTLAEKLVKNSFADKVFFCNSGAEANEAAIKLARKYASVNHGEGKHNIISLSNSFHGRTLATLTATGQTKYQQGFAPLPQGFHYVPLNDIKALEAAVDDSVAAILLEVIQGEGGVFPADLDYLKKARELADEVGALLIFDEIQTGMGRTGRLFSYEWSGVTPDIMTLAKALAGGLPVGAMLATDAAASAFKPGDHASTFGGTPLVMRAGSAVMDVLTEEGFLEDVRGKAAYFKERLQALADKYKTGDPIRGEGFILGWPMDEFNQEITDKAREKGLLINNIKGTALRLLPPLTVTPEEMDEAIAILDEVLTEVYQPSTK